MVENRTRAERDPLARIMEWGLMALVILAPLPFGAVGAFGRAGAIFGAGHRLGWDRLLGNGPIRPGLAAPGSNGSHELGGGFELGAGVAEHHEDGDERQQCQCEGQNFDTSV